MLLEAIDVTEHQKAFINELLSRGSYESESEVVRVALRLLEQQQNEDDLKLEALRMIAKDAFDSLDRGEGIRVPVDGLRSYLQNLSERSKQRRGHNA